MSNDPPRSPRPLVQRRRHRLLPVLLATVVVLAPAAASAQLQPGYATGNVGDAVVAWPNGLGGKAEACSITALVLAQSSYMVKCPTGEYWLLYSQVGKMTPEAAAALGQATNPGRPAGAQPAGQPPAQTPTANPTATGGDFKVGDRVEIDGLGINHWENGVVIAADANGWVVRTDKYGSEQNIPRSWYPARIHASNAALTADQQPDRTKPTGILDCPWKTGITKKAFSTTVAKNLIRCLYDWKNGDDDLTRFDITRFTKGSARRWNWATDIGPGTPSTSVYPIRVEYTWRHWSRQYVQTRTGTSLFNCFYGTTGYWECGLAQRINETQPITRPRA